MKNSVLMVTCKAGNKCTCVVIAALFDFLFCFEINGCMHVQRAKSFVRFEHI